MTTTPALSTQATSRPASPIAEEIRLELANAWGEMGAAWGVAPAIARVHAYLMARGEPLTEREPASGHCGRRTPGDADPHAGPHRLAVRRTVTYGVRDVH